MKLLIYIVIALALIIGGLAYIEKNKTAFYRAMQSNLEPSETIVYSDEGLELHVFYPESHSPSDKRPAIMMFHGGAWRNGTSRKIYPYAYALVDSGYVGISVQYTLYEDGGPTVFDSVKSARAALRFLSANASQYGIDPNRIVVGGGSSGGQLALGTVLFDDIDNEETPKPAAIILLWPVLDTSENGFGNEIIGDNWESISPYHRVKEDMPPTLLFQGTADVKTTMPVAISFAQKMSDKGNEIESVIELGGVHGYANLDESLYYATVEKMKVWLNGALRD